MQRWYYFTALAVSAIMLNSRIIKWQHNLLARGCAQFWPSMYHCHVGHSIHQSSAFGLEQAIPSRRSGCRRCCCPWLCLEQVRFQYSPKAVNEEMASESVNVQQLYRNYKGDTHKQRAGMGHHHPHWSRESRQASGSLTRAEWEMSYSAVATQVRLRCLLWSRGCILSDHLHALFYQRCDMQSMRLQWCSAQAQPGHNPYLPCCC